jgi:large subunit ribosomal protein L21
MWAVAEINKKQYLVKKGDVLEIERIKDAPEEFTIDKILLLNKGEVYIGTPYLEGVEIKAKIIGEKKGDKIIIYKYRRRKKYRRKKGHRQIYTLLKVADIIASK